MNYLRLEPVVGPALPPRSGVVVPLPLVLVELPPEEPEEAADDAEKHTTEDHQRADNLGVVRPNLKNGLFQNPISRGMK